MTEAFAAIIGVFVGACITFFMDEFKRKRRMDAHISALRAEIKFCNRKANAYCKSDVSHPSYRLPTLAYENSLPELIADGRLCECKLNSILEYYNLIESFNRALDTSNEGVAKLKAEHLIDKTAVDGIFCFKCAMLSLGIG